MKNILVFLFLYISIFGYSQKTKFTIYNPDTDAKLELVNAIAQAKADNKHVLVQVGGNWCSWCIKLHGFVEEHTQLDSIIKADYVFIRVNYSKENKNLEVLERLQYPQRFGFPVMVVLNGSGERIHTQETGYLEENKGYSEGKIKRFLLSWNSDALNPENYKKK